MCFYIGTAQLKKVRAQNRTFKKETIKKKTTFGVWKPPHFTSPALYNVACVPLLLSCCLVVLVVKLVGHHSCGADRLPVAVRFPAGPRVRLKTVDPPKGNGLGQKKSSSHAACLVSAPLSPPLSFALPLPHLVRSVYC